MPSITSKLLKERSLLEQAGELDRFREFVTEAFDEREFKLEDLRLKPLFRELVPGGRQAIEAIECGDYHGALSVVEADAVKTSDFHHILLRALSSEVRDQYAMIPNQLSGLFRTISTTLETERIPKFGGLGDGGEVVTEGNPYPYLKPSADYVDTPNTVKRGFIVPVTKEAIFFDRTNVLVDACRDTAKWLSVNKEKRCWSMLVGTDNTYNYMGTRYDTYYTSVESGPWTNEHANPFKLDWRTIDNAEQLQVALRDPLTNEPIEISGRRYIIVPPALRMQAAMLVSGSEVRETTGDLTADGMQLIGANPVGGQGYTVISSPRLKDQTGDDATWYYGDPSQAFGYLENWGITTDSRGVGTEDEFLRDISLQFKVSERGTTAVLEPRYMIKNNAA